MEFNENQVLVGQPITQGTRSIRKRNRMIPVNPAQLSPLQSIFLSEMSLAQLGKLVPGFWACFPVCQSIKSEMSCGYVPSVPGPEASEQPSSVDTGRKFFY